MGQDCANEIVDLEALQEIQTGDAYGAADRADDNSPTVIDDVRPHRDRHQFGDSAAQVHKQIDAPYDRLRQAHRGHHARGRGEVRVGQDIADRRRPASVDCELPLKPNQLSQRMKRTVSWQMSIPRSNSRSSTCLSDKG